MKFTDQQKADWKQYERVRKGGEYNMYDPRARRSTGLSDKRYGFAQSNYTELKAAVEKEQ